MTARQIRGVGFTGFCQSDNKRMVFPEDAPAMVTKRAMSGVIAAFVAGGGLAIIATSMSEGTFSLSIGQAIAQMENLKGKEVRVTGKVALGSLEQRLGSTVVRFAVADEEGHRLECVYDGMLPDPFAEGRQVILQGRLEPGPAMRVSKITVKCPSKYREAGKDGVRYREYYRKKRRRGN